MKAAVLNKGFSLIELVIVLTVIGILAIVAFPRFVSFSTDAKVATLENIASQIKATASLAQNKARAAGLRPVPINPNAGQSRFIIDFGFGSTEVDHRNLCPESEGEFADRLKMLDFIDISSDNLVNRVDNQYTLIGYDIPASGTPTNQGCFIIYDSFGSPNCTVTTVTVDC